jgi:hypothetical protein
MSVDAKTPLFTKVLNNIQNLAHHRSFLFTELIYPDVKKVIPEDCNLLSKMRESLEKEKNRKKEADYRKIGNACEKGI